jgi:hypothetical protein
MGDGDFNTAATGAGVNPDPNQSPLTLRQRILSGAGVLTGRMQGLGPGQDPLTQQMEAEHQTRIHAAQMYQQNWINHHKLAESAKAAKNANKPMEDPENPGTFIPVDQLDDYISKHEALARTSLDDYTKIAGKSKETKAIVEKNKGIVGAITGLFHHQQKQQQQPAGQAAINTPPPPATSPGTDVWNGPGGQRPTVMGQEMSPPPKAKGGAATPSATSFEAAAGGPGLAQALEDKRKLQFAAKQEEIAEKLANARQVAIAANRLPKSSRPVVDASSQTSVSSAIKRRDDMGEQFNDFNGNEIDLELLPPGTMLTPIHVIDPEKNQKTTYYQSHDPKDSYTILGNRIVFFNPSDPKDVARVEGVAKNLGITNWRQQETIGADGKPQINTFKSTRVPVTASAGTASTVGAAGAAAPAGTPTQQPATGPIAKRTAPPSATGTPATGLDAAGKPLGLPSGAFNVQSKVANSVSEARNSLIGDDPDNFGGLAADLYVLKNPESVQKISEYLGLVEGMIGSEGIKATGQGPVAALEWYSELPQTIINLQQGALRDASAGLNEDETNFVSDYFRVLGTIGGMRVATGAGAQKWAFNNLKMELPAPGPATKYNDFARRLVNYVKETNVPAERNSLLKRISTDKLEGYLGYKDPHKNTAPPSSSAEDEYMKKHKLGPYAPTKQ